MAMSHELEFLQHFCDLLTTVGVFVRYVDDLAPIVVQFGLFVINDGFSHSACGLSLIVVELLSNMHGAYEARISLV